MPSLKEIRDWMVDRQILSRGLDDPNLEQAFRTVPRERFVSEELREFAYEDGPLPIGEGQTISQPYIVALMIDAAEIGPASKVLEVGAGSGYAAAVLSRMSKEVFAIERHEILARQASERVNALGYDNAHIVAGDGMRGLPQEAPFDAILVAARGAQLPEGLKKQVRVGGTIVIPIGDETIQSLQCHRRTGENEWETHDLGAVRFVPLLAGSVPEEGTRSATNHKASLELTLPELVARAAEPLPGIDDPSFAAAFDKFSNKRIVLLGEGSHGTHEFYAARAAITKRFVEQHGFTIIATEADWPDAAAFDRYIRGHSPREGAPTPFRRFPIWMWRNTVVSGLLADLHEINEQISNPSRQAGFYGLDIYNMSGSIEAVLAYLDDNDPEAAAIARERYGCLTPWQADPATYGRMALSKGYAKCEQPVTDQCRELLGQALHDGMDGDGIFSAAMNARLVASAEKYYRVMYYGGAESWNLRDSHMAETLDHLLDHAGPQSKAIVWAHNSHIGDARATAMGVVRGEHNIGQLVRQKYGDQAALIGFGTHTGSVLAASDWDGPMEVKRVLPSRRDSYERVCHETGIGRFLLDMRNHEALKRRLEQPRLERYIGVIYRPESERLSHYSEAVLPNQFDAYVWFDETGELEPITAASEEHQGAADTFPFGL